jgi:hypothetical protein
VAQYQHHIQLKTPEQIDYESAVRWYQTVKQYAPPNITYAYQKDDNFITMEYGISEGEEFPHTYVVPLTRDITAEEAQFVVAAWEFMYDGDFDIELSSTYNQGLLGDIDNNIISIDPELKETAIVEMRKWHHNRWLHEKLREGWRYGLYLNSREKTHPALREWDSLTEGHRRSIEFSDQEILEWIMKNLK